MVSPGSMTASLDTSGTSAARWVTPLECRGPRRRRGRPQGVRRTGVPDRAQAREERTGLAGAGVALRWETPAGSPCGSAVAWGGWPLERRLVVELAARRRTSLVLADPLDLGGRPLQAGAGVVSVDR